jgi:hypothetical protein
LKDISKESDSIFDSYLENITSRPSTFAVYLENRPTLVFKRTEDWDEMQAIRLAAINQVKAARDGNVHAAWKKYIGSDLAVVGRVTHLARRHVGLLVEGKLKATPLGELDFLKMAKIDPHGFSALMEAFNDEIGVGWTVEDRDYFREAEEASKEEQDAHAQAAGSTEDLG